MNGLQAAGCRRPVAMVLALAALLMSGSAAAQTRATFAQLSAQAAAARDEGRTDAAIALYRRAVALRPAWDEGQWYLGTLLYEQQRWAEARAAFAQVVRVHPAHAGAVAMTGLSTFQLGDYEAALRSLLQSRQLRIQNTPELATVVRYHTGILLTRVGEFEAANQVLVELAAEGQESPQTVEAFGVNLLRMPMLPSEVPPEARARVRLAGEVGTAIATRSHARGAARDHLPGDAARAVLVGRRPARRGPGAGARPLPPGARGVAAARAGAAAAGRGTREAGRRRGGPAIGRRGGAAGATQLGGAKGAG